MWETQLAVQGQWWSILGMHLGDVRDEYQELDLGVGIGVGSSE